VACASDGDCASGQLVCAGFTSGAGVCEATWARGSFGEVVDVAIPDAGTLSRQLTAYGLAASATDVELRATILHDQGSQLRVRLTAPDGRETTVYDGAGRDDSDPYVVVEGNFPALAGGAANGVWTLRVVDGATGAQGKLIRWDLTVTSR
jgi:subtilisin-like proprotein convertase family protein